MKIPTAKEILDKNLYLVRVQTDSSVMEDPYTKAMIEYAKIHSKLTAKACAEIPPIEVEVPYTGVRAGGSYYVKKTNKKAMLKAYPLNNIK